MTAPALTATDHVGYVVADLPGAIAHFEGLGFTLLGQAELAMFGLEVALLHSGEQKVELLRVLDADADRRRRGTAGIRLDHVAYRVADLDAAMAAVRDAGAVFTGPDDRPRDEPIELAGSRHIWATVGEVRLQLLQ
jgi:catechol 2,3-dioxygenase-like lactoylglutathione lyase family enzyme